MTDQKRSSTDELVEEAERLREDMVRTAARLMAFAEQLQSAATNLRLVSGATSEGTNDAERLRGQQ